MASYRRLTDQERLQIPRQRAKGVSTRDLAASFNVSSKTICNVLSHGRTARSANDSRTRV